MNKMAKLAYFTIDDSPGKYTTRKVDLLKKKKIPALFFCRGDFMEKNPEPVIYALKNGFVAGNHAYSHTPFSKLTIDECLNEILKTDQIIDDLYEKAKVSRGKKYFRYPFGTKGNIRFGNPMIFLREFDKKFNAVENHLKQLGYEPLKIENFRKRYPEGFIMNDTDTFWTRDIKEWQIRKYNLKFDSIEKRMDKSFSSRNGNEIILVHDHEETQDYFERIVNKLILKGFEFLEIK